MCGCEESSTTSPHRRKRTQRSANQRRHNSLRKTRTLAFSICLVLLISFWLPVARMDSQEKPPDYKNPRLPVDRRVADLLSRMTLEEKVAQLTCLWGNRPQVNPQTNFSSDR